MLRRIALLVIRARQDDSLTSEQKQFSKITSAIDSMKRSVVLGTPFAAEDVSRLRTLVKRLPKAAGDPHSGIDVVRSSTMEELRELVARVSA